MWFLGALIFKLLCLTPAKRLDLRLAWAGHFQGLGSGFVILPQPPTSAPLTAF